jgi:hypothetical protein
MKVAFLTEGRYRGRVPRDYPVMRTDLAWISALEADHVPLLEVGELADKQYDIGIFVLPKRLEAVAGYLEKVDYRSKFHKVAFMQEGPQTYFQDYPLNLQFWYYDFINNVDAIFVHNYQDQRYYNSITDNVPIYRLPSLLLEDPIKDLKIKPYEQRHNHAIIGGNFTSWYSGFDSYIVAREFSESIAAPSMGRSQPGEDQVVQKIPYKDWKDWMHELNNFRYAVHMMRTFAAGTFSLNCAYLGIPCIGYYGLDTQSDLHPNLTFQEGDIEGARKAARRLRDDRDFYNHCSTGCRVNWKFHYREEVFIDTINHNLNKILNGK